MVLGNFCGYADCRNRNVDCGGFVAVKTVLLAFFISSSRKRDREVLLSYLVARRRRRRRRRRRQCFRPRMQRDKSVCGFHGRAALQPVKATREGSISSRKGLARLSRGLGLGLGCGGQV